MTTPQILGLMVAFHFSAGIATVLLEVMRILFIKASWKYMLWLRKPDVQVSKTWFWPFYQAINHTIMKVTT